MSLKTKRHESYSMLTEFVLPNDTNTLGNLMGGRLLHWMDIAAAIAAHRHCGRVVVTASVNNVSFNQPIRLGEIVTLGKKYHVLLLHPWKCLLMYGLKNNTNGEKKKCNEAIYTFVAVDQLGNPINVPQTGTWNERRKSASIVHCDVASYH